MKVLLLPGDKGGCGYHRMTEPARAVADAFPEIEIEVRHSLYVEASPTEVVYVDTRDADVVVMQRPIQQRQLEYLRRMQAQGVAVVVELDDLLGAVPVQHGSYDQMVTQGVATRATVCAREADWVTVSTPGLLAAYAPHGRGSVVENAIPRRIAELTPAYETVRERTRIGWTGLVASHPLDLQEMGFGLRQAMDALGDRVEFAAWNPSSIARCTGVEPDVALGWNASVDDFLTDVGQLDIGLAPLRDDRFNRCKSWLKPLEYAARGVHTVRSRVAEYDRLGIGMVAKRPRDWETAIHRAVEDPNLRIERAAEARERVLASHLTEHTAERWVAAWKAAADARARSRGLVTV